MIYTIFNESFTDCLYSLIPDKKKLVDFISQTLHLDKRAVSRRLQGDYQFRINEVLELCSLLNISLDEIILKKKAAYQPSSFIYYPFENLTRGKYESMYSWLEKYKVASKEKGSYVLLSCNILPEIFCFQYENLIRLQKLKWGYYMDDLSNKDYMDDERVLEPEHHRVIQEFIKTIFEFEKLLIIWDYNIIPSIIKDIEYFTNTGYLTQTHRKRLKEELLLVIDQLNVLCKDYIPLESTHSFTFAISSTLLKKTHSVFKGQNFKICVDSAFYTTYLYVSDSRIVETVEHIIQATLKSSVVISQSNERERLKFIGEQMELVERI